MKTRRHTSTPTTKKASTDAVAAESCREKVYGTSSSIVVHVLGSPVVRRHTKTGCKTGKIHVPYLSYSTTTTICPMRTRSNFCYVKQDTLDKPPLYILSCRYSKPCSTSINIGSSSRLMREKMLRKDDEHPPPPRSAYLTDVVFHGVLFLSFSQGPRGVLLRAKEPRHKRAHHTQLITLRQKIYTAPGTVQQFFCQFSFTLSTLCFSSRDVKRCHSAENNGQARHRGWHETTVTKTNNNKTWTTLVHWRER